MAVYRRKRSDSEMQFISTARIICKQTAKYLSFLPKRYAHIMSQKIFDVSMDILNLCCEANYFSVYEYPECEQRQLKLREAYAKTFALDADIGVAHDCILENPTEILPSQNEQLPNHSNTVRKGTKALQELGELLNDERKYLLGLLQSDSDRFKNHMDESQMKEMKEQMEETKLEIENYYNKKNNDNNQNF